MHAAARRAAEGRQVPGLRLVERPLRAGRARSGRRRPDQCPLQRLGGSAAGPARLPGRVLGRLRRGGRGRRRRPAGGALRAVPRPAGRGARRAPGDPRQGPDRPRLRRAHLLGHRRLRAGDADGDRARCRRGCPALAALDPRPGQGARPGPRPAWRRLPVAHDPRSGVLGLLAGRYRCLPRQRRHRLRRRAVSPRHRRRAAGDRLRPRDPRRDGPPVDVARPPRQGRGMAHRWRDRTRRVHRPRRRQRLHQPARRPQPAGRRRRLLPAPAGGRGAVRQPGGAHGLAQRGRCRAHPLRRGTRGAPAVGALHRVRRMGLHRHQGRRLPAPADHAVLPDLPQAGRQAGRPGSRHALVPGGVRRRAAGAQRGLLREAHRPGLDVVGVHPGDDVRAGRPARPGARLPARGGADRPARSARQRAGRRAHGVVGRRVERPGRRVRRPAGRRRHPRDRSAAAEWTEPAGVPRPLARDATAGRGGRARRDGDAAGR